MDEPENNLNQSDNYQPLPSIVADNPSDLTKGQGSVDEVPNTRFNRSLSSLAILIPGLILLGILGIIVYFIVIPPPPPLDVVSISASRASEISVDSKRGTYNIRYAVNDTIEGFSFTNSERDLMASNLRDLSKQNTIQYSPFFSPVEINDGSQNVAAAEFQRKIIDITLDVSGSVRATAASDAEYYDITMARLKEILAGVNMRPGDRVRVRFLGANKFYGGSKTRIIDFSGPQFSYSALYQNFSDRGIINLEGFSLNGEPPKNSQSDDTARSQAEMTEKVVKLYRDMLSTPQSKDRYTFLLGPLNDIVDDNENATDYRFNAITYIVLTDGEFNVEPSFIKTVGVGYCDEGTYTVCHQRIIQNKDKIIGDNDLSLGNPDENKVFFVGLVDDDDPLYKTSLKKMFESIYSPISNIKFLN